MRIEISVLPIPVWWGLSTYPFAFPLRISEISPMTTIIRLFPFILLILATVPVSTQAATVPAFSTSISTYLPVHADLVDPSEELKANGGEDADSDSSKSERTGIKKYLMYGLIGLVSLLFIWFFVRPFIQGIMGKGPEPKKKE